VPNDASPNGTLIYLLYGEGRHHSEALFSVYSLLHVAHPRKPEFRVVFYSDRTLTLPPDLPVIREVVSRGQLDEWSLSSRNIHRSKFFVLRDALSKYGGACVYLDADTYFIKSPELLFCRIGAGASVMHIDEGPVGMLWKYFAGHSFAERDGRSHTIAEDDRMWNSGVIGLHADDATLISDMITVHDSLIAKDLPPLVEQFSAGYVLGRKTELRSASDVIYHYWGADFRSRFNPILETALAESRALPIEARSRLLSRYRPRLAFSQRCKRFIKGLLIPLRFLPPEQSASHSCFAPGLPRRAHGRRARTRFRAE
jgi:hypothetical protein